MWKLGLRERHSHSVAGSLFPDIAFPCLYILYVLHFVKDHTTRKSLLPNLLFK